MKSTDALLTENPVYQTILQRIKNPFIGGAFLFLLTINYKGLTVFLLSGNSERIEIIRAYSLSDLGLDLSIACILAFIYIIFTEIALPYFGICIGRLRLFFLEKSESQYYSRKSNADYKSMEEINTRQVHAELSFIRQKEELKLSDWDEQRTELNNKINDLNSVVITKDKQLQVEKEKLKDSQATVETLKAQIVSVFEYKDSYEHYKAIVETVDYRAYVQLLAQLMNYKRFTSVDETIDTLFSDVTHNSIPKVSTIHIDALSSNQEAIKELLVNILRAEHSLQKACHTHEELLNTTNEMIGWSNYLNPSHSNRKSTYAEKALKAREERLKLSTDEI